LMDIDQDKEEQRQFDEFLDEHADKAYSTPRPPGPTGRALRSLGWFVVFFGLVLCVVTVLPSRPDGGVLYGLPLGELPWRAYLFTGLACLVVGIYLAWKGNKIVKSAKESPKPQQ